MILDFWTAADAVPPCGFEHSLIVEFFTDSQRLPFSSTCSLTLYLPRGQSDPDLFQSKMEFAILGTHGFGKV